MHLQVFLLTSRSRGAMTQRVLLRRLRTHVILSVIWLLWSLVAQIFLVCTSPIKTVSFLPQMQVVLYSPSIAIDNEQLFFTFHLYRSNIVRNSLIGNKDKKYTNILSYLLLFSIPLGVMIASTLCQDVVHCLVVSNYCIECHLLMSYVGSISERVVEKSMSLEIAMKVGNSLFICRNLL